MRRLYTLTMTFALAGITVATAGGAGPVAAQRARLGVAPSPGHVITKPTAAQSFLYNALSVYKESNGDFLITDGGNWDRSNAKVEEMNPKGKPIWVYTGGLDFPHSAYPVGKDIVISDTNNNRVFEIDRAGNTIWSTDGNGDLGTGRLSDGGQLLYPNDAYPMPNNQLLISSRFNSTVWEIKMDGASTVTWKCDKFMFRQHRPRMLPNGNLMVPDSDHGRVIIINHACTKILFDDGGFIWPRSFDTYPGGNYIVGDSQNGRVVEINSHKKILRQWTHLPAPYYVQTEKNGNLLMANSGIHGIAELSKHGGFAHEYPTKSPNKYGKSVTNGGFESGTNGWIKGDLLTETLPPGQRAAMTIDNTVAHTGSNSASITWGPNQAHLAIFWQQTLAVTPGKKYHFSGWIKTQNVVYCNGCDYGTGTTPFGAASYYIVFVKPGDPNTLSPASYEPGYSYATMDWQQETKTFKAPKGVTQIQIRGMLFGRGTVWFDDVALSPA